jgi:hypothetical protein
MLGSVISQGPERGTALERFPEHARLIGCIIAEWTVIESELISLLAVMSEVQRDVVSGMLTAIQSSSARLTAMEVGFARLLGSRPEASELAALLKETRGLLLQRDRYAHALFAWRQPDESTPEILVVIGRGSRPGYDLPLHDLEHQFKRFKSVGGRVGTMVHEAAWRGRALPKFENQ